mmetsp:Transcript_114000/g.333167  ORF Transcript_114000/g.333167 Transcript_114000/m.333167 type:complete len:454 (+) Transcript_114000:104-1465(+)
MVEADPAADATALPNERESASRMFLTTIDAETKVKHKDGQKKPQQKFSTLESTHAGSRIGEHHQDLTNLALTLDQRMNALLQEHEKDFFLAYKTHMYTVQKEIKTLRMKADHEEAKTREDTKIKALEGELDWFVQEAVRLDELCRGYKKEVDKWKAKADALDEDRRFLEDQIKGAKRQNKILRAAAERARSSAYSALLATRAKSEALENGDTGFPGGREQQLALPGPEMSVTRHRPRSASGAADTSRPAAGSGAKRVLEARSRTPDARQSAGTLGQSASSSSLALQSTGRGGYPGAMGSPQAASMGALSPIGGGAPPFSRSVLGNEAEERYVEAIQHLKESIVKEQHTVRMLQAARASSYSKKSEMEEFFLKCIDEARRELMRKQHLTLNRDKGDRQRALEAMLKNEDVLVSLYEKLFPHRTGIARSLGGPFSGGEDRMLMQLPPEDAATHGH